MNSRHWVFGSHRQVLFYHWRFEDWTFRGFGYVIQSQNLDRKAISSLQTDQSAEETNSKI